MRFDIDRNALGILRAYELGDIQVWVAKCRLSWQTGSDLV